VKIVAITASQVPSKTANSIQVMKACQALVRLGHELILLAPGDGTDKSEIDISAHYGLNHSFPVKWQRSRRVFRRYDFALAAARQARKIKADLVLCWPLQAAVAASMLGLPTVLEMHGPPEGRFGPGLFRAFLRLKGKKRLLVISEGLRGMLQRQFGALLGGISIVVAPNGVEIERYSHLPIARQAREMLNLPEGVTVGYTGHLYAGRGMKLLAQLAKDFPHIRFLWVGGRDVDVQYWRNHIQEMQLANVTMTGFMPNEQLPLYQAAADILLMPYERVITGSSGGNSAEYASPMKMFEYMASQRVIISSDLPVIREILNDSNSVLCPPDDRAAWGQSLMQLLNDPSLRQHLANQAWQDVQAYTWEKRAEKALTEF
jgi:glycosyltransferase involved in cell wall biosynthesis